MVCCNVYFLITLQGAAILYMLETVLGQTTLRQGLREYLNEHKFDNAETKDLWTALSSSTNETIRVKVLTIDTLYAFLSTRLNDLVSLIEFLLSLTLSRNIMDVLVSHNVLFIGLISPATTLYKLFTNWALSFSLSLSSL